MKIELYNILDGGIPERLQGLKTIELRNEATAICGKKLDSPRVKSLWIDKLEFNDYVRAQNA